MRAMWKTLFWIFATFALLAVSCRSDNDVTDAGTTTDFPDSTTSTSTTTTITDNSTGPPATSGSTEPETETVTVYFSTGDGSECVEVSPFIRAAGEDGSGLQGALHALIVGPTEDEVAAGASSFFSSETTTSLTLVSQLTPGLTEIGFGDLQLLIPNASTSCASEALLAQLNSTLLQYVPRVRYEMLGSCQFFANWLQRECMDYTSEGAEPAVLTTVERASGSGCEEPTYGLNNGQWFGFVDLATASEIEFDIACWFDGDAAIDATNEDGEESPPPNGYYIRNGDDLLVTGAVAPAATVSWLPDMGDPSREAAVAFDEWVTLRDSRPLQPGVWLTVRNEQVVKIVEQYVP
jgi:hypothetical protein